MQSGRVCVCDRAVRMYIQMPASGAELMMSPKAKGKSKDYGDHHDGENQHFNSDVPPTAERLRARRRAGVVGNIRHQQIH